MQHNRIPILDGFRAIAILAVILYHFFSRYLPPFNSGVLYPNGDRYNYFQHGNLGVQFFFMISGFVIYRTLENKGKFTDFWKKRYIRLFPSMVIASVITFIVFRFLQHSALFPLSSVWRNLLPGISFISPEVWNLFSKPFHIRFDYINGSYWSLWPEIQFYLVVSLLYYWRKKEFLRNFIACSCLFIIVYIVFLIRNTGHPTDPYVFFVKEIFTLPKYSCFFGMGILFYVLYRNKAEKKETGFMTQFWLVFFFYVSVFFAENLSVVIIYLVLFMLFLIFLYKPQYLFFLNKPLFSAIGVSSYFTYLIHEKTGLLLIHLYGSVFNPYGFIGTLLVMGFILFAGWGYTVKIESWFHKKANRFLFPKYEKLPEQMDV